MNTPIENFFRQKGNMSPSIHSNHGLATLVAVFLMACLCAQADGPQRRAVRQEKEQREVRNAITEGYPKLNELPNSKHGYAVGLANVIMEAVRMSVFYRGQQFKDAAGVFGLDERFMKEWMCIEEGGRFVVLIPLEYHDWQIKVPHTVGVQWHLALEVGKDATVKEVGMKYCSPKTLLLKGIRTGLFTESTLAKSIAEQGGAGQPATRPESKSEGSDKPLPEAEGRSR